MTMIVDLAGGSIFGVSLATGTVSADQTGQAVNMHACHVKTQAISVVKNYKADIDIVPKVLVDGAWVAAGDLVTAIEYVDPLNDDEPTSGIPSDQGPTVAIVQSFLRPAGSNEARIDVDIDTAVNFSVTSVIMGQPRLTGSGGGNDNYPSD